MDKTDSLPTAILEKNYVKKQVFFSFLTSICASLIFYFIPDFPFDRKIVGVISLSAFMYLLFFIFFEALHKYYHQIIIGLSVAASVILAFIVHMSGGIISPLVFFYFAVLMSEAAYGTAQTVAISASILSYSSVVLGEAFGLLEVHYSTAEMIYRSPWTVAVILLLVTSFMFITGHIARIIIMKLRLDVDEENRKQQAILKRFGELDSYAHIGLLAHRIAHDLRGPLAFISGYCEMERFSPDKDDEEKAALSTLAETVVTMSDALNNITSFGRATDGKKEKIKMKEFFRNLISIVAFYKDAQSIQFRQNYPDADDVSVMALRQDLQQAYFNILKNAVEAVRDNTGDKIVDISVRQSEGMLEVCVMNNGQPIPEEILAKLFQKAVTGKPDGTGVGLLITRDLLIKNDISISVKNMDGAGVMVSTRMPLAE